MRRGHESAHMHTAFPGTKHEFRIIGQNSLTVPLRVSIAAPPQLSWEVMWLSLAISEERKCLISFQHCMRTFFLVCIKNYNDNNKILVVSLNIFWRLPFLLKTKKRVRYGEMRSVGRPVIPKHEPREVGKGLPGIERPPVLPSPPCYLGKHHTFDHLLGDRGCDVVGLGESH